VNLTRIESRPARTSKWEYVFFVDIEGHVDDPQVATALESLKRCSTRVQVLGSYPRAVMARHAVTG
ncbi:MAG: chorismate mutase, partial [Xanthomonadales bacterium]|nr:chorismate mutase [Xanthomonadales bacterium]